MSDPGKQTPEPAPGQPTTDRVKGIFSAIAPSYDRFNRLSSMGIDRLWRRRTVRLAKLDSTSRVLDLAAGTGDLTMALARQGRPASILSTDFVPQMLEIGKQKAAAYEGPTKILFEVVDAQDLPFDDAEFDRVTVAFGVRNLPDRAANFKEVQRVLRPGGRYVILEFSRPTLKPFRVLYHFYLRTVIPFLGGALTGDRSGFDYLNESILAFPPQLALSAELHKAGFSTVEWHNLTFGIVAVHVAVK
ncbi:MAG: bifunctional demethylmenaquinone methyltransferase/2-methoxy-6-polyprenyl-1,4-benzoquinol methylase UbiE [Coriobacteriia bacterium]|nr:bifunctional demethylmenaquinone methyltransferase/2-methoxy-6-polyprenyl-1,4-benzoquinol methylase UbiE [Coriobacteriia bacterium]MBN2822451.1 bifunctional demethylmenaquinone methyltransferase/2-methoxy-6-polyprenyl-1,4-benzoquinol methylase UbiE [Coriobacteriia bacterium]